MARTTTKSGVTLRDIADEVGLSVSAVSMALLDHPRIGAELCVQHLRTQSQLQSAGHWRVIRAFATGGQRSDIAEWPQRAKQFRQFCTHALIHQLPVPGLVLAAEGDRQFAQQAEHPFGVAQGEGADGAVEPRQR